MATHTTQQKADDASRKLREAAVRGAIEEHGENVMRYLIGRTGHQQDAEDIFQQLWVYALRRGSPEKIQRVGWLKQKAKHLHYDLIRSRERKSESELTERQEAPKTDTATQLNSFDREDEAREKFWSEHPVPDLPEERKEALWLFARYGFTFEEVAERLGVSSSTAHEWASDARKKLAAYLNHENQTENPQ